MSKYEWKFSANISNQVAYVFVVVKWGGCLVFLTSDLFQITYVTELKINLFVMMSLSKTKVVEQGMKTNVTFLSVWTYRYFPYQII